MNDRNIVMSRHSNVGRAVGMPVVAVLIVTLAASSFYVVDTGHVGVERTLGKVDLDETAPGLNVKLPIFTSAYEFCAKEIALDLNDLRPKAADSLPLKDPDVTVYYNAAP